MVSARKHLKKKFGKNDKNSRKRIGKGARERNGVEKRGTTNDVGKNKRIKHGKADRFGKKRFNSRTNFKGNASEQFNRKRRFATYKKQLHSKNENKSNVHVGGNNGNSSRERKNEKFGKSTASEKQNGEKYGKGKLYEGKSRTYDKKCNTHMNKSNMGRINDSNARSKNTVAFKNSEDKISSKTRYDVYELFNSTVENKVLIKQIDPEFIKHMKEFYDMTSNVPHVLKNVLEEIVTKKVLREKGYMHYDDIHMYVRKIYGKLNIAEDKMKNKQKYEEDENMKQKIETEMEKEKDKEIDKKKDKEKDKEIDRENHYEKNEVLNHSTSNDVMQKYEGTNDEENNKKEKGFKDFKKKVLFIDEVERLFFMDEKTGEIKMKTKAWNKWITTMLRSKITVHTDEVSVVRTKDQKKIKEKDEEKPKKKTIYYNDIPIFLQNLYNVNEMHIATTDEKCHSFSLSDNPIMDWDKVLQQKVNKFEVFRIVYQVGLNLIHKNFEVYVDNYAEDEDKIYLDIINNTENIFVDRVNNMSVLVKKNPWVYIMYLKVLLDLYHVKDNAFTKKAILRCLQYVFTNILPKGILKNFEDNDKQILTYIFNLFYSRFNFTKYSFSSFYFFFNALIYLYTYEQFLKNLYSQYIFILQNGVYSSIPSLFYASATYLGEFYVDKEENKFTILNILIDAHLKIVKGNPLILRMLKSIINSDEESKRYISTILFEKALANINACVTVIVDALKMNSCMLSDHKKKSKEKKMGRIKKKHKTEKINKEKHTMHEIKNSILENNLKINRCLYLLYHMNRSIYYDVEENIMIFAMYLFEVFSLNIFDIYQQKQEFFGKWSKEKIHIFTQNTIVGSICDAQLEQKNKDQGSDSFGGYGERNEENEKIKNNHCDNRVIQDAEENECDKLFNTASSPVKKEKEKERQHIQQMKKIRERRKKEEEEEERKKLNLYYYLQNRSVKLLSTILFKNIHEIIQRQYNKNHNKHQNKHSNKKMDLTNKTEDKNKNTNKEQKEEQGQLKILNCNSLQNIIKHIESYSVKIHLLNILFIVAFETNQLNDDMYCYFYTTLTILHYYENENSPNFYAMLTVLILTDTNLTRNIAFIKRIFQYSMHSKESWVQLISQMMMKYIFLKKKVLSDFLYYAEKQLYQKNIQTAKQIHIEKCKKYGKKDMEQVQAKEYAYDAKLNNPLDSNAVLTHFYEFYEFSALLNDNFFPLLREFQNSYKFGSSHYKKQLLQFRINYGNIPSLTNGGFGNYQNQAWQYTKKEAYARNNTHMNSLQNPITTYQRTSSRINERNAYWKQDNMANIYHRHASFDMDDDIIFNIEEQTMENEESEPCHTLDLDDELDTPITDMTIDTIEKEDKMKKENRKSKKKEKEKNTRKENNKEDEEKLQTENYKTDISLMNDNVINTWSDVDFPLYTFDTRKIISIMLNLEMEYTEVQKHMNMYSTFVSFLNDSEKNETIATVKTNKQKASPLSHNTYQQYLSHLITLYRDNGFKKLCDKFKRRKTKKKEKVEEEEKEQKIHSDEEYSDSEEAEADQYLDDFIYKNFNIDEDLIDDDTSSEDEQKKTTQKRKRNDEEEQFEFSGEESDSTNETYGSMLEDEMQHVLEFDDYAKMKKGKME